MRKHMRQRKPKTNSIPYYIEEVVCYRSEKEAAENLKDSYPPVVPELLLSILISVRAIRFSLSLFVGFAAGHLFGRLLEQLLMI